MTFKGALINNKGHKDNISFITIINMGQEPRISTIILILESQPLPDL